MVARASGNMDEKLTMDLAISTITKYCPFNLARGYPIYLDGDVSVVKKALLGFTGWRTKVNQFCMELACF